MKQESTKKPSDKQGKDTHKQKKTTPKSSRSSRKSSGGDRRHHQDHRGDHQTTEELTMFDDNAGFGEWAVPDDDGVGALGMSAAAIEFDPLDWDAESAFTSSTDGTNQNKKPGSCFQLQFPSMEGT